MSLGSPLSLSFSEQRDFVRPVPMPGGWSRHGASGRIRSWRTRSIKPADWKPKTRTRTIVDSSLRRRTMRGWTSGAVPQDKGTDPSNAHACLESNAHVGLRMILCTRVLDQELYARHFIRERSRECFEHGRVQLGVQERKSNGRSCFCSAEAGRGRSQTPALRCP